MMLIPRILLLAFVVGAAAMLAACKYHEPNSVTVGSGGSTGGGTTGSSTGSSATVMDIKGQPVTFTTSAGSIQNLTSMPVPAFAPSAFTYPNGFFVYKITGLTKGATVTLTIALPAGTHPVAAMKCGAATCSQFAGATIKDDVLTLTLTDGGAGDSDGLANGEISDDIFGDGSATSFPVVSLSANSLDFGEQTVDGVGAPQIVTLTNNGNAPLLITPLTIFGEPGFNSQDYIQTNNCPKSLAPGTSCQISLRFHPDLTGQLKGAVIIDTNVGRYKVELTGVGTHTAPFATNEDKGLSVLKRPTTGGCDSSPQGVACTPVPGLQSVTADARDDVTLSELVGAANNAGFIKVLDPNNVYRSSVGNLFREALKSVPNPAPVQVSSESQATGALCSEYVVNADYSNPLAAFFFYQLPGADGNCFTADDIFRYTPLNADASTAPHSSPTQGRVEAFYDASLKAISFVAPTRITTGLGRTDLVLYDANLQNPKTVVLGLQGNGAPLAQNLGGKLYQVFDQKSGKNLIDRVTADGTVSTLQTLSGNILPGDAGQSTDDGVNFYYLQTGSSGATLLRLAMDGSGPAVQIGTLPTGVTGFQLVGTTDQAVLVQGSLSDGSGKLYGVPKKPPAPPVAATTLDTIPARSSLTFKVTQRGNLYFTVQADDLSTIKAVTAKDDGSSTTSVPNARWAYYVVDNQTPAGLYDDRAVTDLILVHGITNFAATFDNGATVSAVHLADGASTDLTTLNYTTGVFLRFPDNGDPLGVGTIFQGTVNGGATDMFAFEIKAHYPAARFVQITNTGANPGLIRGNRLSGATNGAKRLINFE